MKATIYCECTAKDVHSFYLKDAMDFSKARQRAVLIKTMTKLPAYIRFIEREYDIEVFEQTRRKNRRTPLKQAA